MTTCSKFFCPACEKYYKAPPDLTGPAMPCPACGQMLLPETTPLCAICQSPLSDGEAKVACPDCHTEYHAECWQENQGCAVYGCAQVPDTEGRSALEVPTAYW